MFQQALEIAYGFTHPVIISRRTVRGTCGSGIGTFVVVNDDGWIVTAGHILRQWHKLATGVEQTQAAQATQARVKADTHLSNKERSQKLSQIVIGRDDNDRCSAWWANSNAQLKDLSYIDLEVPKFGEAADIGVGRLDPFDKAWIKNYPVFKDPTKNFEPGKFLCKLGHPFHEITPVWDEPKSMFVLPPGALPLPRFPIEGMFTRVAEIQVIGGPLPPFPFRYLETSTPGLRGQSGGPIIDSKGTVWAIQAKTSHLKLGFEGLGTQQYLNVGLGVHPDTIFGVFDQQGIKYQKSDY